jgi:hypothetical protein
MTSAGQFIEDDAERPEVALDAALAGDELLGRHVGDGASAGGVGRGGGVGGATGGLRGIEFCFFKVDAARETEVENLGQAAVGEHDVRGLEIAMKDAERVGGAETVGDLDAH